MKTPFTTFSSRLAPPAIRLVLLLALLVLPGLLPAAHAQEDPRKPLPQKPPPEGYDPARLALRPAQPQARPAYPASYYEPLAKGVSDPRTGHVVTAGFGVSPSYTWIDSNELGGPAFAWFNIASLGTPVALGDDSEFALSLPFSFRFFGQFKGTMKISSNGYLTFGDVGGIFNNEPIPSANEPNDIVAPFWDDLHPGLGGTVHYYHHAAQNRFIVQYTNVPRFDDGGAMTFQVILYQDGRILFQYKTMTGTKTLATVGVEGASGLDGAEVAFNAAYVANNLAVLIEPALDHQKVSATAGGLPGPLRNLDEFGTAVVSLGNLNTGAVPDVAVGAPFYENTSGVETGAVFILFMRPDGTVASQKIVYGTTAGEAFGSSVAMLRDLDGDGVQELAVGAPGDNDGGSDKGAVWILYMRRDGTVKSRAKISDTQGNFTGILDASDHFGQSLAGITDQNADGVADLAVGASGDDDGGSDKGAIWVLFLNRNGTVKSHQKISDTQGNFAGIIDAFDEFGSSVTSLQDHNRDGAQDLAVGAPFDDDGGTDKGAVWILFLNRNGTVKSYKKISDTVGNFKGRVDVLDFFGYSVHWLNDFNGDNIPDLAVGAPFAFDHTQTAVPGAVWVLHMNRNGTVKGHVKISYEQGGFAGSLDHDDFFGRSVAQIGDLNGNGMADLIVGAPRDDDGGSDRGGTWVLFMNKPGTVGTAAIAELVDEQLPLQQAAPEAALTYSLERNNPNPFHPSTEIRFALPEASHVSLVVYDVLGREVARLLDEEMGAGRHAVRFDAAGLPSGVYFYRMRAGTYVAAHQMVLLK